MLSGSCDRIAFNSRVLGRCSSSFWEGEGGFFLRSVAEF